MDRPKISVIIPIYNVSKYIEKCVRSLYEQSLDSIEYIFVDDHSSDDSINILLKILNIYQNRKSHTKIIRHERNMGVSKSRQDGIEAATGEYIIHCDSDDWIEFNMYELLYLKAKELNADIVGCNFFREDGKVSKLEIQNFNGDNHFQIDAILKSKSQNSYLWNRLIKNSIIKDNNITFNSNLSLWEDLEYVIRINLKAKIVGYVDYALYHYRVNNLSSIVNNLNESQLASGINALNILNEEFNIANEFQEGYRQRLMMVSLPYLVQSKLYNPQKWYKLTQNIDLPKLSIVATISLHLTNIGLYRLNHYFLRLIEFIKRFY